MHAQRDGNRFYGLQVLRFVAAVLVVATHAWASTWRSFRLTGECPFLDHGILGVDIFFSISGFVLYVSAKQLVRAKGGGWRVAADFFRRRFFRVAPSYYLLTLLKLLLFVLVPASMAFFRPHLLNTLASFLFITRFRGQNLSVPVLAVGWTLCYEMLFYLVLAGLLWVRVRLLPGALCVLGAFGVMGYLLQWRLGIASFVFNPILLEFAGGMVIAATLPVVRRIPKLVAIFLFVGAFWWGLGVRHNVVVHTLTDLHLRVYALSGWLIVLAVVALEQHVTFYKMHVPLLLGDASYALYLTHQFVEPPLVHLGARLAAHAPGSNLAVFGTMTAVLVGCSFVAVLYHLHVENPMTRFFLKKLPWSMTEGQRTA